MPYVITEPCIGVKDKSCVDVCPFGATHGNEEDPQLYIDPQVCIDCGACVSACPVEAIFADNDVPEKWREYTEINAAYFEESDDSVKRPPKGAAVIDIERIEPVRIDHPKVWDGRVSAEVSLWRTAEGFECFTSFGGRIYHGVSPDGQMAGSRLLSDYRKRYETECNRLEQEISMCFITTKTRRFIGRRDSPMAPISTPSYRRSSTFQVLRGTLRLRTSPPSD